MKHYLKQLSQIVILNFVFFVLLGFYLKQTQLNVTKLSPEKSLSPTPVSQVAAPQTPVSQTPTTSLENPSQTQDKSQQLGQHNTTADCWVAIEGHIYDITTYFGSHPGGDATLGRYCGQDATQGFETKDKSPGMDHSGSARGLLQQYLIQ